MTVRELIAALAELPPDATVFCCRSEAEEGDMSCPWEADSVRQAQARWTDAGCVVFIEDAP